MKRFLVASVLVGCSFLTACQSTLVASPKPSNEALEIAQEQLPSPRKLYGPPPNERPQYELGKLRKELLGLTQKEVANRLGKPHRLFMSGGSESWDYQNVCYASAAGRTVTKLEIWFENGRVDHLGASF